jgi:hypothetical protein
MVSMPSRIVDEAWHEFILFTRDYQDFCQKVFGQFLHHIPTESMTHQTSTQRRIQLTWRLACQQEGISLQNPDRLLLLFAIDEQLGITEGFYYTLNCFQKKEREPASDSMNSYDYDVSDFTSMSEGSSCCAQGCGSASCCGNSCSGGSCGGE